MTALFWIFFFFWFSDFVIWDQLIKRGFSEETMIHIVGRHLASIGLWVSWWWFSLKCFELWLGIAVWCRFWVPICIIILFGGIDAIHYSYLDLWMSLTLALTFWFFNGFFKRLICTFLSLMDFIVATQCSHLSNRFYDFDLYIYIYIYASPLAACSFSGSHQIFIKYVWCLRKPFLYKVSWNLRKHFWSIYHISMLHIRGRLQLFVS